MKHKLYQLCINCVMDTSDPDIKFNQEGICNYCQDYDRRKKQMILDGPLREKTLEKFLTHLKLKNSHKSYDCIIGLSGGIDSSYLAYWAKHVAKLRLLAVHVDGGWNSEIATSNIEKIVKKLDIDLHTHVFDWHTMRDLQVAFLKSGVANQDTPQDHAFFAALYNFASKSKIQTVLSGYNFVSESILPRAWGHSAMDLDQIEDIHKKFGSMNLSKFPKVSFFKNYIYYPFIKKIKVVSPLNLIDYNPIEAIQVLERELDWTYYGGKHYESRFTKFFQAYWLPERFEYDKRRAHLSSLILSQIITREKALEELNKKSYDQTALEFDKIFIAKKLNLSVDQLDDLMKIPIKKFSDYKNNQNKIKLLDWFLYLLSLPKAIVRKIYTKISI